MIVVAGEALVDLVIEPDGSVTAALGGAPFNTARACGRLGADVAFLGAISDDRFGRMLRTQLVDDHVSTDQVVTVDLPTTLAAAELDGTGAATYRFYFAGTSVPALDRIPDGLEPDVVFTGGLGLVLEPMASTVEALVTEVAARSLVMIDVNCRPYIVPDRDTYVARIGRVLASSDVAKVSDEDVAYLFPGRDPVDGARSLLDRGPRAVLLTAGGGGVRVLTAAGESMVPVEPVEVVDTIGAGDSFGGGFVSWWQAAGLDGGDVGSLERLRAAVMAANEVAGVVCTRRGAEPPWRSEMPPDWSP